ncbi:MAG: UMP kinase [Candidatus Bathyarchaeota archaeon]|nr:UMP kinase [Candidatus Bathyarchaeota archaeon]
MKVSLSLGGSLLTGKKDDPTLNLQPDTYMKYARVINELHEEGHELMIVCGGGKPARHFISVAKKLGGSSSVQDMLGVKATHINALLMMAALGDSADQNRIYQRASDLNKAPPGKILVGGGFKPGSSTDYRAVIFAEKMSADLIINATDIDGIYNKNPRMHKDAIKLETLSFKTLQQVIKENTEQAPGEYGLFDMKAVKLARKLNTPVVFIDGTDPEEIRRAIHGNHSGSVVKD